MAETCLKHVWEYLLYTNRADLVAGGLGWTCIWLCHRKFRQGICIKNGVLRGLFSGKPRGSGSCFLSGGYHGMGEGSGFETPGLASD